ncbi:MAG TPA: leukotriene A4 hydrolase C-terminal domain-containing protein [Myxococcales bacterium]|nr:leukotriene A4 hydrolase C-terminal domain-containing protein [Myxococcales bacterium]
MRLDPHSYADTDHPRTRSIDFALAVDFKSRQLSGEILLHFHAPGSGPLDLDTRDLRIDSVATLQGAPLRHALAAPEPILGARLRIDLPSGTSGVRIHYATSPRATALQWLEPSQTAGGLQPFLFSQAQPIHARSLFPLQDTPRNRITVGSARFTVPARLRTLMAAAAKGRETQGDLAVDAFEMPQPIPPYLLAFAVGDLTPRQLSARCAVWAERALADAAAEEFAQVEDMLVCAEELFGPYDWDRYDILVMPPSFPYGGMENPRLTFVTPSVLAGDKSLVNVIAHELAHAWTGNLVSNATANDFWLNEGFTVYAERRILEALDGVEAAELHAAIGLHDLRVALERFKDRPQLTRLRTELSGIDPDEAYSTVPYEKGYLLLRKLELTAGRAAWDDFLRAYLENFRFQSITTQEFLDFLEARLPGLAARARALEFIDKPGLPPDAPIPRSPRLTQLRRGEAEPQNPTELLAWLHSAQLDAARLREVDARYGLSTRRSLELRHTFVLLQLRAGVPEGIEGARRVALETGRMKYLRPVFTELARRDRDAAARIYEEAKGGYHNIARAVVEGLLKTASSQG